MSLVFLGFCLSFKRYLIFWTIFNNWICIILLKGILVRNAIFRSMQLVFSTYSVINHFLDVLKSSVQISLFETRHLLEEMRYFNSIFQSLYCIISPYTTWWMVSWVDRLVNLGAPLGRRDGSLSCPKCSLKIWDLILLAKTLRL